MKSLPQDVNNLRYELDMLKKLASKENIDRINRKLIEFKQLSVDVSSFQGSLNKQREQQEQILEQQEQLLEQQEQHLKQQEQFFEQQSKLVEEVKEITDQNAACSSKLVLQDVLETTSKLIVEDLKTLACYLVVNDKLISELETNDNLTTEEKMMMCFESKNCLITWKTLKCQLQRLHKDDIINKLKEESLLTVGLQDAHCSLKKLYMRDLNFWIFEQLSQSENGEEYQSVDRMKAYVDLANISGSEMNKEWSHSDLQYHLKQRQFERTLIPMEYLLEQSNQLVIVQGIAGIGKTTMLDSYVLKWADGKILTGRGNSPKIDFVFKLTCRDLNTYATFESASSILLNEYSQLFKKDVKIDLEDLEELADRVLILVDGVDELRSIHKFTNASLITEKQDRQFVKSIHALLEVKAIFLNGHKTFVAGRPHACALITSKFNLKANIKLVEVCGFNSTSVEMYVNNYFAMAQRPDLSDIVKRKIKESDNLTVMASIPIYIWVICGLFREDTEIESPKTTTHLCSYACLLFIKKHLKSLSRTDMEKSKKDFSNMTLSELRNDDDVLNIILTLAELSKLTLKEKKVVFSKSDLNKLKTSINLEDTGFIVKHNYGLLKGSKYQFRHLALQEYLTSMELFVKSENIIEELKSNAFSCCLPIVAGLSGIAMHEEDEIMKRLLINLRCMVLKKNLTKNDLECNEIENTSAKVRKYLEESLLEHIQEDRAVFDDTSSLILSAFYEKQEDISANIIESFSETSMQVVDLMHHHDIRNVVYLVEKLQLRNIQALSVLNVNNDKLPDNTTDLLKLYFSDDKHKKALYIGLAVSMSLKTDIDSKNMVKNLHVYLSPFSNEAMQHEKLVLSALCLVNETTLDLSWESISKTLLPRYNFLPNLYEQRLVRYKTFCISILSSVYKMHLNTLRLQGVDDDLIIPLLHYICSFEELDLSFSSLQSTSIELLVDEMKEIERRGDKFRLNSLCLNGCNLDRKQITELLPIFCYINELDYSLSSCSTWLMEGISEEACNTETFLLRRLYLRCCELTDGHILLLKQAIPHLVELDISANPKISPQSIEVIYNAILEHAKEGQSLLNKLNVSYTGIRDKDVVKIKALIKDVQILGN